MAELDLLRRPLRSLRISVTDRCNLRCGYCMPEEHYAWLPRVDLLTFEEIERLARAFVASGVDRVRLTGGEPLLRRELAVLVRLLAGLGLADLALTTNAILLADQADALRAAGLGRLTISLDSLDRERFTRLTRRDELPRVLEGIEAAAAAGFRGTKLNTVVLRGENDDELAELIAFGQERGIEVRFIEYMDVGGATRWSMDDVVPATEILERVGRVHGRPEPLETGGPAPAERFRLPDGTVFGVIASTTRPFCRSCDRSRLTADGMWYLCLYARDGLDLRGPLRAGADEAELLGRIRTGWTRRDDRGAERRLAQAGRGPLAEAGELASDPHLEMHTRGG